MTGYVKSLHKYNDLDTMITRVRKKPLKGRNEREKNEEEQKTIRCGGFDV